MKYTNDFKPLGLPNYFKFGIELEANNVKTKGKNGLYVGKSSEYIKSKNWHMASKHEESLVAKGRCRISISNINRYVFYLGKHIRYL